MSESILKELMGENPFFQQKALKYASFSGNQNSGYFIKSQTTKENPLNQTSENVEFEPPTRPMHDRSFSCKLARHADFQYKYGSIDDGNLGLEAPVKSCPVCYPPEDPEEFEEPPMSLTLLEDRADSLVVFDSDINKDLEIHLANDPRICAFLNDNISTIIPVGWNKPPVTRILDGVTACRVITGPKAKICNRCNNIDILQCSETYVTTHKEGRNPKIHRFLEGNVHNKVHKDHWNRIPFDVHGSQQAYKKFRYKSRFFSDHFLTRETVKFTIKLLKY